MRARWLVVIVVVLGLLAASCGRSDDEQETGAADTTAPAEGSEGGGGGATGAGDFGDLTEVCGDGDASGATAQGVTDDEIAVGTFADPGFAGRPGLNQELFDAAEVFTAWCNEAGGINGREIVLNQRDTALTEVRARTSEACREDFFLVGGGAVFDNEGQEDRLSCLLPDISGFVVTSEAKGADLLVQPVPNAVDAVNVGAQLYIKERFPDTLDSVGYLTGSLPTTVTVSDQNKEAAEALGFETVHEAQYNAAGESSWAPFAEALRSNEVKGLQWTGEPENLAKLLQAVADLGYELEWVATAVEDWTGGGLHAPSNPGENRPAECITITEATPEGFQVAEEFEPRDGLYDCNPENVFELEGDYGRGVTLEDVGKTMADLQ
jgi:hypothetical protein